MFRYSYEKTLFTVSVIMLLSNNIFPKSSLRYGDAAALGLHEEALWGKQYNGPPQEM